MSKEELPPLRLSPRKMTDYIPRTTRSYMVLVQIWTSTAPSELTEGIVDAHICSPKLFPQVKGSNRCWLNVPLVLISLLGIGRMEGDRISVTAVSWCGTSRHVQNTLSSVVVLLTVDTLWPVTGTEASTREFTAARAGL